MKNGSDFNLTNVNKQQIYQPIFNQTPLIMTELKNFNDSERFCRRMNGRIMMRSQVANMSLFLAEKKPIWSNKCLGKVWTDDLTAKTGNCESFDSFSNKSSEFPCNYKRCFICVLDQRRSIFKMMTPDMKQIDHSFTILNDKSGDLVLIGNDVDELVEGKPPKIFKSIDKLDKTDKIEREWKLFAAKSEGLVPGMNDFKLVNGTGNETDVLWQTKLSNVSFERIASCIWIFIDDKNPFH